MMRLQSYQVVSRLRPITPILSPERLQSRLRVLIRLLMEHLRPKELCLRPAFSHKLFRRKSPLPSQVQARDAYGGPSLKSTAGGWQSQEVRKKVPEPYKFTGATDKHVTCVQTWFDTFITYCDTTHINPIQNLAFFTTGAAQQWVVGYMSDALTSGVVVTREQLRTDFLVQFGDIRRHTAQSARERFHAGEHSMKPGEKVNLYTQRFRTIVWDAKGMSQVDQIFWYLHGLLPALKKACATDALGKDWVSVEDLIRFALSQELRANIAKTASNAHASVAAVSTPSQPRKQKRKRSERSEDGDKKPPRCIHCAEEFPDGFPPSHLRKCDVFQRKLKAGLIKDGSRGKKADRKDGKR
ncbi:hypothetical protein PLESTB_001659100 [Pleodorina starrii]|uniref:Retrotransposon gag domain-containing protein n=1 Tax=Pleodorina starrii TaxID=330485 RepID=A0A9W6BYU8_9CHLO|nr:hypothetical protein PLESTB_001659100 [Pleodorina starrii]